MSREIKADVGTKVAGENVARAVEEALSRANATLDNISKISIGLAGVGDSKSSTERAAKFLTPILHGRSSDIYNDGLNAYTLANLFRDGITYVCGTGSVIWTKIGEVYTRRGGWGWLFSYDISAFSIARNAIVQAAKSYDGFLQHTVLIRAVESYMNLEFREALDNLHEKFNVGFISAFAPLVIHAATEGDEVANEVLNEVCKEIAEEIGLLLADFESSTPEISIVGGISQSPVISQRVSEILDMKVGSFPGYQVVVGGLLRLLENKSTESLISARKKLLTSFELQYDARRMRSNENRAFS